MLNKLNQQGISTLQALLFAIGVVITLGVGLYLYDTKDQAAEKRITNFAECAAAGHPIMESYPEQCSANGQTFTNIMQHAELPNEIPSGKGKFAVTFPDGWGPIHRDTSSDFFIISGQQQPEVLEGKQPEIINVDGYGSDGPAVFSIYVQDDNHRIGNNYFGHKNSEISEYTLVNAKENPIKGKKYSYAYPRDEKAGIGYWRYQGDRDYEYVFDLPGPTHLHVAYSVHGVDPRNNLETVEQVINSIRLLQ